MNRGFGKGYQNSFRVFCRDHHEIEHKTGKIEEFLVQRLMGQEGLTRDQAIDQLQTKRTFLRGFAKLED